MNHATAPLVKKLFEGYANLYSNGLNQNCDICWFLFGAGTHWAYALLGLEGTVLVFALVLSMKKFFPTDYDLGDADADT